MPFNPTFSSLWNWMRLNRHFHTFELLRTPPHKPQKSIQNDHETVRFCNGLGRHPNLRISRHSGTSGRLVSKRAFKPTFSNLWSWIRFNRHFRTFEALRIPSHKTQNVRKSTTESSVLAKVCEAIEAKDFDTFWNVWLAGVRKCL